MNGRSASATAERRKSPSEPADARSPRLRPRTARVVAARGLALGLLVGRGGMLPVALAANPVRERPPSPTSHSRRGRRRHATISSPWWIFHAKATTVMGCEVQLFDRMSVESQWQRILPNPFTGDSGYQFRHAASCSAERLRWSVTSTLTTSARGQARMAARHLVSPTARRAHRSISSALKAAATSHRPAVVEIEPGFYQERLVVQGHVELVGLGDPGSVVIGQTSGSAVDTFGAVRLAGLTVVGRGGDAVLCRGGTLTVEHSRIQGDSSVAVHAKSGAAVTLRNCAIGNGRTLFAGSTGLVEHCRFDDAVDNAIAVIEGADVHIRGSRVASSRLHGIRVSGARAHITGCELTGTGLAAIMADARADLTVLACRITEVHGPGVSYIEQSRGLVEDTQVIGAEHGIVVANGAAPIVRRCGFTRCRDTGINIHTQGLGRFEDCEVAQAGNVAVFSTTGGSPDVNGCRIFDGHVGIAVANARGRFARVGIHDLTSAAIRLLNDATGTFSDINVERCPTGVEALGGTGTKAELVDTRFLDCSMTAVTVMGQSRVTLRNIMVKRGLVGCGVIEEGQLRMFDCAVEDTETCGVIARGKANLTAKNLTVTDPGGMGLSVDESAHVQVTGGEFANATSTGIVLLDTCAGRLENCSITGTEGWAVLHNGSVHLNNLRTSLPVKRAPKVSAPKETINNFHGPVFNAAVKSAQLAWDNKTVSQQQATEPS